MAFITLTRNQGTQIIEYKQTGKYPDFNEQDKKSIKTWIKGFVIEQNIFSIVSIEMNYFI